MDESSILVIRAARSRKQLRQSSVDLTSSRCNRYMHDQKIDLSSCMSEPQVNTKMTRTAENISI